MRDVLSLLFQRILAYLPFFVSIGLINTCTPCLIIPGGSRDKLYFTKLRISSLNTYLCIFICVAFLITQPCSRQIHRPVDLPVHLECLVDP